MQGIQPASLTDEELVRMALLVRPEALPPAWVQELLVRFERALDDLTLRH
jgi:hypothetical protein